MQGGTAAGLLTFGGRALAKSGGEERSDRAD